MQQEQLYTLIKKYFNGTITAEERKQLYDWYHLQNNKETQWLADINDEEQFLEAEMLMNIRERLGLRKENKVRKLWKTLSIAASILLACSIGGYFILYKTTMKPATADLNPSTEGAILKTAGGQTYNLANQKNGLLASHAGTTVTKTANGQIVYQSSGGGVSITESEIYDTLITQRNKIYHLTLQDGTRVLLNAASTIRFPQKFLGKERKIELISGEAYLQVVHNNLVPFRVKAGDQLITDIGTEFNINNYPDEEGVKTTLVEGAASVALVSSNQAKNEMLNLRPGEQAFMLSGADGGKLKKQPVDLATVVAWKDGMFRFNDEKLGNIMKQVSRWYDAEVIYEDEALKNKTFAGVTTRYAKASQLLHYLEMTGEVKFKIEGKKITVKKTG